MKKFFMIGGTVLFGAMFVVGLIVLESVPNRFDVPFPVKAVVGGSLAMFATLGGFVLGFIQVATAEYGEG